LQNFNGRLQRENAKTGAITASLAWNDPADLDFQAKVWLKGGGFETISYRNKRAAGGYLDVDMHANDMHLVDEPVENIFWKKPPAGLYSISVNLYKDRSGRGGRAEVPFRTILKREDEEDLSVEGQVSSAKNWVEVFRFKVDGSADTEMQKLNGPLPVQPAGPGRSRPMRAMRAARTAPKAKAKAKAGLVKAKLSKAATLAKKKAAFKAAKKAKVAKAKAKAKAKIAAVKAKAKGKYKLGTYNKVLVFQGKKLATKKGLKKDDFKKSKEGKIVSVKKSALGKESKWAKAVAKARVEKGYVGFKAIKKGGSFYEKAKELMGRA